MGGLPVLVGNSRSDILVVQPAQDRPRQGPRVSLHMKPNLPTTIFAAAAMSPACLTTDPPVMRATKFEFVINL